MRELKKEEQGVTFLEILLVLAIASSAMLLAIRVYVNYSQQASLQQIQYDIDSLFQAMNNYYLANCLSSMSNTSAPVVVTWQTLQTGGFLASNWAPHTGLVQSYKLQFNPVVNNTTPVTAAGCVAESVPTTPPTACTPVIQALTTTAAKVSEFMPQVAIELTNTDQTSAYQSALKADCLSAVESSGSITPCASSPQGLAYLVWQRNASSGYSNSQVSGPTNSNLWLSTPRLQQFQLQYTHDQMYELIPGTTDLNGNTTRLYSCGG